MLEEVAEEDVCETEDAGVEDKPGVGDVAEDVPGVEQAVRRRKLVVKTAAISLFMVDPLRMIGYSHQVPMYERYCSRCGSSRKTHRGTTLFTLYQINIHKSIKFPQILNFWLNAQFVGRFSDISTTHGACWEFPKTHPCLYCRTITV